MTTWKDASRLTWRDMKGPEEEICKKCGAKIIRIKVNERNCAFDAEPFWVLPDTHALGHPCVFFTLAGDEVFGRVIGDAWDDDPDANVILGYVSHKETCKGKRAGNRKPRTRAPGYR